MTTRERLLPKVGDRLGRYELVQELGRGGFGAVFRARQEGLSADVAVKQMLPQQTTEAQEMQIIERFEQEALVISLRRRCG